MMKGASKSGALLYSRDRSRKRLPQRTQRAQRKTKDQNPPPPSADLRAGYGTETQRGRITTKTLTLMPLIGADFHRSRPDIVSIQPNKTILATNARESDIEKKGEAFFFDPDSYSCSFVYIRG